MLHVGPWDVVTPPTPPWKVVPAKAGICMEGWGRADAGRAWEEDLETGGLTSRPAPAGDMTLTCKASVFFL